MKSQAAVLVYLPISDPNPIALPLKAWNAPSPTQDKSQYGSQVQDPLLAYLRSIHLQIGLDDVDFLGTQGYCYLSHQPIEYSVVEPFETASAQHEGLITQRLCTRVVLITNQYGWLDWR